VNRADVLRLAQPRLRRFVPGAFFGLLSALCAVALLGTSAYLITKAAEQPPILYLSTAMVAVRAFALGRAGLRYAERLTGHDAAFSALPQLRVGVYERLVPLAPDGLGGVRRGDLIARLVADVDEQQNLPLRVVQPLVVSGLTATAGVVLLWLLLPAAGVVLLAALAVAAVLSTVVGARMSSAAEGAIAGLRGRYQGDLADYLTNLDTLVAYGAAESRRDALLAADADLTQAVLRRGAGTSVTAALMTLVAGCATLATLVAGIPQLGSGGFDGPALAVVALVPLAVFEVFGAVPLAWSAWRQVASSADRIASVVPDRVPLEIPVDGPQSRGAAGAPAGGLAGGSAGGAAGAGGADAPVRAAASVSAPASAPPGGGPRGGAPGGPRIRLRGLSARWPGADESGADEPAADEPALRGIDLDVLPGERILVRGPSGSGKTTLAHVLVRFLEFEGRYELDGVDVRSLPPDEVRRVVGLCEQHPHLFDEDIRQNLLFARETASDKELLDVLGRVGLGDWVRERGGLTARVGERGALISGGQAQRIALARAILAGFPVLMLDEPTANVDADRAEALVADLLAAADDGTRAVVLISHSPVAPELVTATLDLARETAAVR
jgi:ATP-binding cassette subfamily C protein CydC